MKLVELFNANPKLTWERQTRPGILRAWLEVNDRKIVYKAWCWPKQKGHENTWEVSFIEETEDNDRGYTHDLTGNGGELQVFGGAKAFIEKVIADKHPDLISCEAEPNRASMYRRALKKFTPTGYTFSERELSTGSAYFTYTKNA